MGMSVGAADEGGVMVEMNTTPLIDVMLVLLIMFIMSLPVQTHAVKLDMPRPNQNTNPPAPPVVHTVEVDFDGTVIWDGNVTQNLAQVTRYLASVGAAQPQPEVHLRPHRFRLHWKRTKENFTRQRIVALTYVVCPKTGASSVAGECVGRGGDDADQYVGAG